jgi:uncharacterized protein (TIGR03089 family)
MSTPGDLWRVAAAAGSGRPFLPFYDDATGERVELSFATTDNWIAKTANLIVEEMCAEPGERIAIWLPIHWQTVVWHLACWNAGVIAAPGADPRNCDHAVADPGAIAVIAACPGSRVLVPMLPLGASGADTPPDVINYATEVAALGDRFVAPARVGDESPALELGGRRWSGAEVVATAGAAATEWGLTPASRVLCDADPGTFTGLHAGLLAPLAARASIVLCRNLDETKVAGRVIAERITDRLPDSGTLS